MELDGLEVPNDRGLGPEGSTNANPGHDPDAASESSASVDEYLRLRLAGSLSTFKRIDTGARIFEEEKPFELCPPPSVLQVCRESRAHTLRHFTLLRDLRTESDSFYLNPRHDMVWLSMDITDDGAEKVTLLRETYGQQLACIRNILVHECDWYEWGGINYCETFFSIFEGLDLVTVLLQDDELEEEPSRIGKPRNLRGRAKELEEDDLAILRSGVFKGTLRYVGRDNFVYGGLQWSPPGRHGDTL